jgi:membrane protease YdiL (CAAX protease family)
MNWQTGRRGAALLEVLGVYLAGLYLQDRIGNWLVLHRLVSPTSPFDLLTVHTTNSELLVASRQMFLGLMLQYVSYFLLIIPIGWWYRRRGPRAYGLTRAGHSWKTLILAGLATAVVAEWPVLLHTAVDAVHPMGAMAPWRQAFFDMSWRRWQFWLFAAIMSYALIPILEELIFRGYYQRRLAEDWGDGPSIIGTACFFTFAHSQYLIANAYNATMIASLLWAAIGFGVVFARTRSLIPSMIAHAIMNVPMTPVWQGVLLLMFTIGALFCWRGAAAAIKQVFRNTRVGLCAVLAILQTAYVIAAGRIEVMTYVAIAMIAAAVVLETMDPRRDREARTNSVSA